MTQRKKEPAKKKKLSPPHSEIALGERHLDLVSQITQHMEGLLSGPLHPGLYLVATPIGNLGDITLRALSVLALADSLYCEDTRHSRILLSHYKISQNLKTYHEHNAEQQRPRILRDLGEKKSIALISDAGTPLISDPGFKLVSEALQQKSSVWIIPGPSAVLAGISLSGLPIDKFFFGGFLPPRSSARLKRIEDLSEVPSSLIFFETHNRLIDTLKDLAKVFGTRQAAVARELTKMHEEVLRGSLQELAEHFTQCPPLGECVLIIAPPPEDDIPDKDIEHHLSRALLDMSLRDAAKKVSSDLSVSKARVYNIGLKLGGLKKE